MTTENKRDLAADLAVCEAATTGPWEVFRSGSGYFIHAADYSQVSGPVAIHENAIHIAEAREGWPEAIRRAIAAEKAAQEFAEIINAKQAEIERLKKDKRLLHVAYDAQYARATEYSANAQRLGEALHGLLNAIECGALAIQEMSAALDYDIRRAKEALLNATQENNGR